MSREPEKTENAIRPWCKSNPKWRKEEKKVRCSLRKFQQGHQGVLELVSYQRSSVSPRDRPNSLARTVNRKCDLGHMQWWISGHGSWALDQLSFPYLEVCKTHSPGYHRAVREDLSKEMTFTPRSEWWTETRIKKSLGKALKGMENSKCKGREVEKACHTRSRNRKKASLAAI